MPMSSVATMADKPFAEYAERNGGPILEVLRDEFAAANRVLEIGSGTGQHAARFAAELSHLTWQTSDLAENHPGINAWVDDAGLANLLPPLELDARTASIAPDSYDGVFSANTAHIMGFDAVTRLFALVGKGMAEGGTFCLYGPFRQAGEFNTESNAAFDKSLRARNPEMGIRDLDDLDALAAENSMQRQRLYAMPANNHIAVWRRETT